ncbi:hypothetical protein EJB05_50086, partial [Eragrostis curvula]
MQLRPTVTEVTTYGTSDNVTLFPLTIVTLTADTIPRLRYNLFPLEDEDGEGTSEVGGALGPSHQQAGYYIEAPVSSSDDSMHIPDTPIKEGSTEVPETPSNEAKSRDEER